MAKPKKVAKDEARRLPPGTQDSCERRSAPARSVAPTEWQQARQLLEDFRRQNEPESKAFAERADLADSLLRELDQYGRGEIPAGALASTLEQLPKKYRPKLPPSWLSPELVSTLYTLADCAQRAEREHKGASKELLGWLRWLHAAPRGCPPKPLNYLLGQRALKLEDQGLSWGRIAHKLCPDRGQGHECTKKCEDRIRMAARQFRP